MRARERIALTKKCEGAACRRKRCSSSRLPISSGIRFFAATSSPSPVSSAAASLLPADRCSLLMDCGFASAATHSPDATKSDCLTEEDAEKAHFQRVVNSFRLYEMQYKQRLQTTVQFYERMPADQQRRLHQYRSHINRLEACLNLNFQLMCEIVKDAESMFENWEQPSRGEQSDEGDDSCGFTRNETKPRPIDMEKTACVLRQIVREWTREGQQERYQSYGLLVDTIDRYFASDDTASKRQTRILVPGAGLGRLAFELAKKGFSTQGNEYSMFMLIASHFILNKCKGVDLHKFYPFVHQTNNVLHSSHQLRGVSFPDADPSEVPAGVQFSMTAGNFIDVYSGPEYAKHFHCIASCFFVDTAHNILQYIDTIEKALSEGGIWVNVGPLLYHFADAAGEDSIEPSYDFVRDAILSYGFEIIEEQQDVPCVYTQNPDSMLSYVYKCVFFVARKSSSLTAS